VSIQISHETAVRLVDEARRQGITVDALLERLVSERPATAHLTVSTPELPVWRLGALGDLHRRDIYEDAR
jgi:hypothetical protein